MTALALLALLLPIVAVAVLLPALPPGNGERADALVARAAAATGVGIGLSSTAFFLSLLLFDGAVWAMLAFDVGMLVLAPIAWRRSATGAASAAGVRAPATGLSLSLSLLFAAVLVASVVAFILAAIREPHGRWDAWAIWNAKARFLARAGANWRVVFLDETAPPDYPLLLPGAMARAWTYVGAESPLISMVVAALFALAAIGLAVAALSMLRGRAQGMIAGFLLAPLLLAEAANQYADVPLSFYLLATVVLLALHDRFDPAGRGLPLLAGLTAGMAAWTKNEGLIFLFVIVGARSFWTLLDGARAKWRSLLWFALGGVPFLMLNAILKLTLLESAAPMTFFRLDAVRAQLFDPARHWQVVLAVAGQATAAAPIVLAAIGWVALLGLAADKDVRRLGRTGLSALALMLAAYFGAYVVTPHDLAWHVSTTFDRLLIQIAPLAVFTVLLVAASPGGQAAVGVNRGTRELPGDGAPSSRRGGGRRRKRTYREGRTH